MSSVVFPNYDFTILDPGDGFYWWCDDNEQNMFCQSFTSIRYYSNDAYVLKSFSGEKPQLLLDCNIRKLVSTPLSAGLANYVYGRYGIWVHPYMVPFFLMVLIDNSIVVEC